MILTLQQLENVGACESQVLLFRELFGDQVEVTEQSCVAVADKFHWDFAAINFLSAPARAEFDKMNATALAEYDMVSAAAWAEFNKVIAAALEERCKVTAPALDEYNKVSAAAFGRLFDMGG